MVFPKTPSRVKDSPDADASFTLLADVQGLKKWLKVDSVWRHDAKARAVLTKLDKVLVNCNRKEAIRLSQVGQTELREGGGAGGGGGCSAVGVYFTLCACREFAVRRAFRKISASTYFMWKWPTTMRVFFSRNGEREIDREN